MAQNKSLSTQEVAGIPFVRSLMPGVRRYWRMSPATPEAFMCAKTTGYGLRRISITHFSGNDYRDLGKTVGEV